MTNGCVNKCKYDFIVLVKLWCIHMAENAEGPRLCASSINKIHIGFVGPHFLVPTSSF